MLIMTVGIEETGNKTLVCNLQVFFSFDVHSNIRIILWNKIAPTQLIKLNE